MHLDAALDAGIGGGRVHQPGDVLSGTVMYSRDRPYALQAVDVYLECIERAECEPMAGQPHKLQELVHLRLMTRLAGDGKNGRNAQCQGGKKYSWPFALQIPTLAEQLAAASSPASSKKSKHKKGSSPAVAQALPATVAKAESATSGRKSAASRCCVLWRLRIEAKAVTHKDAVMKIPLLVSGRAPSSLVGFASAPTVRSEYALGGWSGGGTVGLQCEFVDPPTVQDEGLGVVRAGQVLRLRATIVNSSKSSHPKATKHNTVQKLIMRLFAVWRVGSADRMTWLAKKDRVIVPDELPLGEYIFKPNADGAADAAKSAAAAAGGASGSAVADGSVQAFFPLEPGRTFRADVAVKIPDDTAPTINALELFSLEYVLRASVVVGSPTKGKERADIEIPLAVAPPLPRGHATPVAAAAAAAAGAAGDADLKKPGAGGSGKGSSGGGAGAGAGAGAGGGGGGGNSTITVSTLGESFYATAPAMTMGESFYQTVPVGPPGGVPPSQYPPPGSAPPPGSGVGQYPPPGSAHMIPPPAQQQQQQYGISDAAQRGGLGGALLMNSSGDGSVHLPAGPAVVYGMAVSGGAAVPTEASAPPAGTATMTSSQAAQYGISVDAQAGAAAAAAGSPPAGGGLAPPLWDSGAHSPGSAGSRSPRSPRSGSRSPVMGDSAHAPALLTSDSYREAEARQQQLQQQQGVAYPTLGGNYNTPTSPPPLYHS